jgi:predicted methyltransferase
MFDQIPMLPADHVRQIKIMAPYLAGKDVAFMGDSDGASLLLGLLGAHLGKLPRHMLLVDFDERLLVAARAFAQQHGFSHLLTTRLYNAFDPIPLDLRGQFDWFYTNPPYGSHNEGASVRLFVTRGSELTRAGGHGCIILPHDGERDWTRSAMRETQRFLVQHDWVVIEKLRGVHRYRLDDDRQLTSSLVLVDHTPGDQATPMPYAGRRVAFAEIPLFYGRTVNPPYPRYIRADGTLDCGWSSSRGVRRD